MKRDESFLVLRIEKEFFLMKRDGTDEKGMTHFPLIRIGKEFVCDEKGWIIFPFLQIEKELYPMKRDGTQWKGMVPDEKGMTHFPLLRMKWNLYPMKIDGTRWKGVVPNEKGWIISPPPSLRIFRSQGSPRVGDLFKASHYWPESYQCIESMPRGAALLEKVSLLFSTIYSA